MLAALTRATDCVWITGNHDPHMRAPNMEARAGGTIAEELEVAGMVLRHQVKVGETRPEFSDRFHPTCR